MNPEHPIHRAAKILDTSLEGLGKILGVTKAAVHQWTLNGRATPAEYCPRIEKLTLGAVRCEDLNPKIDWAYLREAACQRTAAVDLTREAA